ncbi:MAG: hypothetical protein HKO59_11455 [Phycisphaerales bacterium]|nr:hypothetical protein [Phycisphaerales bacterium]
MNDHRPPGADANVYLWDRSGPVDEEIATLEQTLRPLRHRPRSPVRAPLAFARTPPPAGPALAAAAAVIILASVAAIVVNRSASPPPGWGVAAVYGAAVTRDGALVSGATLPVGGWLETGEDARVEVSVADLGVVTVYERSRVSLAAATSEEQRLRLGHGRIEAFITAPPRLFFVETAAVVAVDLGCAYTLDADAEGNGTLAVTFGAVALEANGLVSTVPADGVCRVSADRGPGTPYFADCRPELEASLAAIDAGDHGHDTLDVVLDAARPRDTLTLWHLLFKVDEASRGRVFERMVALSGLPPGVTRDGVLRLHARMLDGWWSALERSW